MLFLHGFPDSWNSFRPVLDLLSLRYRAIAIDQRGFGDSSRPADGYSQTQFAADAAAFLDELSIDEAVVVGHSLGSFVAQTLALDYPGRVRRLVLIGSAPTAAGSPVLEEVLGEVLELSDPIDPEFVREFQTSTFSGELPDGFLDTIVAESLKAPAFVWRAPLEGLAVEDHRAHLAKITQPTFVAWGDQDVIFTREDQGAVVRALPGSVLKVYEGAGHSLNWDHAVDFTRDLEEFLALGD